VGGFLAEMWRLVAVSAAVAAVAFGLCLVLTALVGEFNRDAISKTAVGAAIVLWVCGVLAAGVFRAGLTNYSDPMYSMHLQTELMVAESEHRAGRVGREWANRLAVTLVCLFAGVAVFALAAFVA
jgi:hypothetical protein